MWFYSKVLKKVESIIQINEWITIIIIIHRQEMGCLQCTQYPFHTVWQRLQQHELSAHRPLLWLPLTKQHREKWWLWCTERQNWIRNWHSVNFSDKSQFCDLHAAFWSYMCLEALRERSSPACIWYLHKGLAHGMSGPKLRSGMCLGARQRRHQMTILIVDFSHNYV